MAWIKGKAHWEHQKKQGLIPVAEDPLFGPPAGDIQLKGAPKKIETPEKMWSLFCDYAAEVDENPAEKAEVIKSGDMAGMQIGVDVARPYTWSGFEAFLAQHQICATVKEYKQNRTGNYENFSHVMLAIDKIIETQNYEGAAMRFFDPNLTARRLGLAEKQEVNANVHDDGIDYSKLSDEALEEINNARVKQDWNSGL